MAPFRRNMSPSDWSSGDDNTRKVNKRGSGKFTKILAETNSASKYKVEVTSSNSREQSSQDSSDNYSSSTITFKEFRRVQRDLKLPLPTVATLTVSSIYNRQKEETFKNWLAMKDQEKKLREEQWALIQRLRYEQQQREYEEKKEKYDRWWQLKKIEEENRKREKEKQQESYLMMMEMREKRSQQSEINYQLWLKQKQQMFAERKMQYHMYNIKMAEARQKRMEESAKAYAEWQQRDRCRSRGFNPMLQSPPPPVSAPATPHLFAKVKAGVELQETAKSQVA